MILAASAKMVWLARPVLLTASLFSEYAWFVVFWFARVRVTVSQHNLRIRVRFNGVAGHLEPKRVPV